MISETVESADGTPIVYHRTGEGPSVLLVHGAVATTDMYQAIAAQLSTDHQVVRLSASWRSGSPDVGEIGVIDGVPGHYPDAGTARITFHPDVQWTEWKVSCGGGPAAMDTALTELRATSDTVQVPAWWPGSDAHCAVRFLVTVPV